MNTLNIDEKPTLLLVDDDEDFLEKQRPYFVRTVNRDHPDCVDIGYGLTKICAEKAINILNSK